MRCMNGRGNGNKRGRGLGLGPNTTGYCRFNPELPSRRTMMNNDNESLQRRHALLKQELNIIEQKLNENK